MKKTMLVVNACLALILGALPWVLTGCDGSDDTTTPTPMTTNSTPATVEKTMTGVWHGSFNGGFNFSLSLTQSDNVLNGTFTRDDASGSGPATGQLNGDTLDLTTVREPGHVVAQWHGSVNADRDGASGTWTNITESSSGTFSMNK